MYTVRRKEDGSVILGSAGSDHEILWWTDYTLSAAACKKFISVLREDGGRGSLEDMLRQLGFGRFIYLPFYLQQHGVPYSCRTGYKDDDGEVFEDKPVFWSPDGEE